METDARRNATVVNVMLEMLASSLPAVGDKSKSPCVPRDGCVNRRCALLSLQANLRWLCA